MIRRLGGPGMHGVGGVPLAGMGGSCPAGAAGNGLLNNLIAFWPGNEVNGNALDAHTNALHLTDTNTVTSAAGLVYALARQYTAATAEEHTRAGDDALLSAGDTDFTIAAWVYLDSKGFPRGIAGKLVNAAQYEYGIAFSSASDRFFFYVSNDGTALVVRFASTFGSPALSTWYLVVGWHDGVADTINIQISNGVVDSTNHATGVWNGTDPFKIGRLGAGNYWNGRIGPTMFWKSAGGAGGVLTAAQRTSLYNAGAGLTYAQFTT